MNAKYGLVVKNTLHFIVQKVESQLGRLSERRTLFFRSLKRKILSNAGVLDLAKALAKSVPIIVCQTTVQYQLILTPHRSDGHDYIGPSAGFLPFGATVHSSPPH